MNKINSQRQFIFLISLLPMAMFSVHSMGIVSYFGKIEMTIFAVVVAIYFLVFFTNDLKIYKQIAAPMFWLAVIFIVYVLSAYRLGNLIGLIPRLLQLLLIAMSIYVFFVLGKHGACFKYIDYFRAIFIKFTFLFTAIASLGWFVRDNLGFLNSNVLGIWLGASVLFCMGFFRKWSKKALFFVYGFAFMLMSESRTSIGALIVALLLYRFWPLLTRRKLIFNLIFVSTIILAFFIIIATLGDFVDLSQFNEQSRGISGKNLTSGRQIVWPVVISLVAESPLLGWGGGAQLSDFSDIDLSAHNFYLQVLMQVGFIGLLSVFFLLFSIWGVFWRFSDNQNIRWAASAFFYVLLCQNFEVTLLQNNMALSLPMWCFMALTIGAASRRYNAK